MKMEFILGSIFTILITWFGAVLARKSQISSSVFERRLDALNDIWIKFNIVREIYAQKVTLGYENWIKEYRKEATDKLNDFKRAFELKQILLTADIVKAFRELDMYLFSLLENKEQWPSEYLKELDEKLEKVGEAINRDMGDKSHKIKVKLTRIT